MSGEQGFHIEDWRRIAHIRDREITPNERFWLETIRLASWDSDPAPTLEQVQKLRMIFQTRA
ncbi:MAG: hypothetical protein E5V91_02240 [Mesorhizobium sp.]|uniref:hypothetical protein n=1 Tax=Mesorhizobium sp. M2A.F.Ca.ET.067.02.1.1 TaxID=2496749 RepID=UPI000FD5C25B|nr:hypothetical protein [Mesorhizobium sp. M2A.F.Ca.ET.067.02.1.1]RUW80461.1 hypothetical protein EOA28_04830 [Mesorhizobium sp. M2A.F.Ca.ET.067.02.1.1]TIU58182.1 MAG: hypothetical protein E5W35_05580 [Mesorhizobium sp.]TIV41613.1 MAG: hypothetical protein E5V91_02240 [Mesorhizobium sp.]TIW86040.1 MAG: hypothetical protein E5V52_07025 [Mesorhizobium sp.]